jgi:hypothetical protein
VLGVELVDRYLRIGAAMKLVEGCPCGEVLGVELVDRYMRICAAMKLVEGCPCGEVLGVELRESSLSPVDETVLRLLDGTLLVWIIIITVLFVQREPIFRIKSEFQHEIFCNG